MMRLAGTFARYPVTGCGHGWYAGLHRPVGAGSLHLRTAMMMHLILLLAFCTAAGAQTSVVVTQAGIVIDDTSDTMTVTCTRCLQVWKGRGAPPAGHACRPGSLTAIPGARCHNTCPQCGKAIQGTAGVYGAAWDPHDCTSMQALERRLKALEDLVVRLDARIVQLEYLRDAVRAAQQRAR